jgi:hypothetical protein
MPMVVRFIEEIQHHVLPTYPELCLTGGGNWTLLERP